MPRATTSAKTLEELAQLAGRNHETVRRHLAQEDCPATTKFPKRAREVKDYLVWLKSLRPDRSGNSKKTITRAEVDIAVGKERARILKLDRKEKEGKLILRSVAQRAARAAMHEFKNDLLNLTRSLPRLPGGLKDQIDTEIRSRLRRLSQRMAKAAEGVEE